MLSQYFFHSRNGTCHCLSHCSIRAMRKRKSSSPGFWPLRQRLPEPIVHCLIDTFDVFLNAQYIMVFWGSQTRHSQWRHSLPLPPYYHPCSWGLQTKIEICQVLWSLTKLTAFLKMLVIDSAESRGVCVFMKVCESWLAQSPDAMQPSLIRMFLASAHLLSPCVVPGQWGQWQDGPGQDPEGLVADCERHARDKAQEWFWIFPTK